MLPVLLTLALVLVDQSGPDRQRLQTELDRKIAQWKVPGAGLVLVGAGAADGVYVAGKRSIQAPELIDENTIFPAASLTKAFTATMVASLAQKGVVNVGDPVVKWLEWYKPKDTRFNDPICLKNLMDHSSGYPAHDLLFYQSKDSLDHMVRKLLLLPRFAPPGTTYEYQVTQYYALALAVQKASGLPWRESIQKEVLSPLKIQGAVWSKTEVDKVVNRAHPHRLAQEGNCQSWANAWSDPRDNPSGGLWMPLEQWVPWLRLHSGVDESGMELGAGKDLYKAAKETHQTRIRQGMGNEEPAFRPEVSELGYGWGWVTMTYRGERVLAHGGVMDGFRSFIMIFPQRKQALAVFANLDRTPFNHDVAYSLADLLLGQAPARQAPARQAPANWTKRLQEKEQQGIQIQADRLLDWAEKSKIWQGIPMAKGMTGQFSNPAYGTIEVKETSGGLRVIVLGNDFPLQRIGKDSFVVINKILADPEVLFLPSNRGGTWRFGGRLTADFVK